MANEVYSAGLGQVWAKREATYGTDSTPDATNVVYVEGFVSALTETEIPRMAVSPHGAGFKSVFGESYATCSGSVEVDLPTIATGDSTDRPNCGWALYGGQWAERADSTDKTHTYVLGTTGTQGVTIYHRDFNSADDNGIGRKLIGCKWNTSLSFEAGQRLVIGIEDGHAKGAATPSDIWANLGAGSASLTYPTAVPVVAVGAVLRLQNLSDNALYGGGTLASPTNGLAILSMSFNSSMGISTQKGANATGGVMRIDALRSEHATLEVVLEVTDLNEFDPYELRHDEQPLAFMIDFSQGANKVRFYANIQIIDIEAAPDGQDGRKLYSLTCKCLYFEDAADGTPAAGLSPTQAPKAGTNEGLYADPATALPAGIAALQFQTV